MKEAKHARFTRDGSDLIYRHKIPLVDALTGFSMEIATLDGRTLKIDIKDVVHPSYTKVVPNEGMPSSKQAGVKGNLVISFDVAYPRQLSDEQKAAVRSTLSK